MPTGGGQDLPPEIREIFENGGIRKDTGPEPRFRVSDTSELPDLSGLDISSAVPPEAEPNPENIVVALFRMLDVFELRVPTHIITEIQRGLEQGAYIFQFAKVPALESESGQEEWNVLCAPRGAVQQRPTPAPPSQDPGRDHAKQDPRPPGMREQDMQEEEASRLNVRGEAQGMKREFSWAELQELSDEELAQFDLTRAEVDEMAAKQNPEEPGVPRDVKYVDLHETTPPEQGPADYLPKPEGC